LKPDRSGVKSLSAEQGEGQGGGCDGAGGKHEAISWEARGPGHGGSEECGGLDGTACDARRGQTAGRNVKGRGARSPALRMRIGAVYEVGSGGMRRAVDIWPRMALKMPVSELVDWF